MSRAWDGPMTGASACGPGGSRDVSPMPRAETMGYTRFVEVGRVACINYGANNGKLCTIVDIVSGTRAYVDGPTSGIKRQIISYNQLALTDLKVDIKRGCNTEDLKAALESDGTDEKFANSAWGKKIANKKKRAALTDFERYKVMVARQKRAKIIKAAM